MRRLPPPLENFKAAGFASHPLCDRLVGRQFGSRETWLRRGCRFSSNNFSDSRRPLTASSDFPIRSHGYLWLAFRLGLVPALPVSCTVPYCGTLIDASRKSQLAAKEARKVTPPLERFSSPAEKKKICRVVENLFFSSSSTQRPTLSQTPPNQ
ncbi:hypothetical protein M440DRAFT_291973 [Trichoderma longibrachiatum ATCC 18648]|uniref:Uncharacterized protein n=1 Tax=Trichoderma longibrachiatum ATCC 18648 TaxID=983965 RepID=A0A2T4C889_TRILO|nr:hypothetical protein M440DRAFT_291973 [Trichoderma longibrachiatum ATCC 18648]